MAIWIRWTDEQRQLWEQWVSERPPVIREMIEKYNLHPDRLYRLTTTDQRVTLYSLSENGTVTINVLEKFNAERMLPMGGLMDRRVFGIDPAELEECDWEGEVVDGSTIDTGEEDEGEPEREAVQFIQDNPPRVTDVLEGWAKLIDESKKGD